MKVQLQNIAFYLFWILQIQNIQAQDGTFAFAYNPSGKTVEIPSDEINQFGHKQATTQRILDKLIAAKGQYDKPTPKLTMTNSEQKPAWINVRIGHIYLEEKAYDLCKLLGKESTAAIASILAHEMIHYCSNHDWKDHFLKNYNGKVNVDFSTSIDDHMKMELQADQLGGFLANMAGFNTHHVMGKLLQKIYSHYGLSTNNEDLLYPSLAERTVVTNTSESLLDELNYAFEMSTYLTAVGDYNLAIEYLDKIVVDAKFNSRELYHNKGVLYLLSALSLFSNQEWPFHLPVVFDLDSRLNRRSNQDQRNKLLAAG